MLERGQRRFVYAWILAVDELEHRIGRALKPVIVVDPGLVETAPEARVERIRRVVFEPRSRTGRGKAKIVQIELF